MGKNISLEAQRRDAEDRKRSSGVIKNWCEEIECRLESDKKFTSHFARVDVLLEKGCEQGYDD